MPLSLKPLPPVVAALSLLAVFAAGCAGPTQTPAPAAAPLATAAPPTEAPYAPVIDPANFVAGVNHPYFPLVPGVTYTFEVLTADGTERIEVTTLADTRVIMGVTAMVVRDTASVDGQVIEATFDWYAQDKEGNVWYLGEDVDNYKDGVVINHNGSWEAGVDGALPGLIMPADPAGQVGAPYRQEYYAGKAEDMAQVVAVDESVTVPFGSYAHVLKTRDWTPLEPGQVAHKYYAEGVGFILEIKIEGASDRVELVSVTTPAAP